jgi:hypothetical protein
MKQTKQSFCSRQIFFAPSRVWQFEGKTEFFFAKKILEVGGGGFGGKNCIYWRKINQSVTCCKLEDVTFLLDFPNLLAIWLIH